MQRDDTIRFETRLLCWVVVAVLVPALVVLWGLPGNTEDFWAWPIAADMSQIFLGAGYGAGAYFFTRAALGRRWHDFAPGILSAAFFAAVMLVVTIIHWDKFNHGDAPCLGRLCVLRLGRHLHRLAGRPDGLLAVERPHRSSAARAG